MKISLKPYLDQVEHLNLDEQLSVNHDECPAGRDTRKRLGIKRVESGYVAHCFNCGNSGYYSKGIKLAQLEYESVAPKLSVDPLRIWLDYKHRAVPLTSVSDLNMLIWLDEAGIDDVFASGLAGGPTSMCFTPGALVICRLDTVTNEHITIVRSFSPIKNYLIYKGKNAVFHVRANPDSSTVVLVEDAVSAIKVAKAGFNVIALLGTNLTASHKTRIYQLKYTRFILHLDNDTAGTGAAAKIAKDLRGTVHGCTMTNLPMRGPEAKHLSLEELQSLYTGIMAI